MDYWRIKAISIVTLAVTATSLGASDIAVSSSQVGPGWEVPSFCGPNTRIAATVAFLLAALSLYLKVRTDHLYRTTRKVERVMSVAQILSFAIPIPVFTFADGLCGLQGGRWISRAMLMQVPWVLLFLLAATLWCATRPIEVRPVAVVRHSEPSGPRIQ